ncbi:hypothetical protein Q4548_02620 [Wenyingzhuangia sp. 2_MG-2023]|nr:hypothetical protein [Wenyingzhuangia sp. 2_MG-2023]MDO6800960.1 hypothetical protein [Wenyingzhuangia sp. 1_MG-2023]
MIKNHVKGLTIFLVTNLFAFLVHTTIETNFITAGIVKVVNLPLSYLLNALASLFVCVSIYFLHKKYENNIGFIFLGLSFVKMLFLFLVLNPKNTIGEVSNYDAVAVFCPFLINLVMEQIFVVKILKISDLLGQTKKE